MKGALALLLIAILASCSSGAPSFLPRFNADVYIVRSGDTVYSIAWRYGQDYRKVIALNGLKKPYTIYPGQKLRIRGAVAAATKSASRSHSSSSNAPAKNASGNNKALPKKTQATKKPARKVVKYPDVGGPARWVWPLKGALLSRFDAKAIDRQGIDIKGAKGKTVVASRAGRVVYTGSGLLNYGRLVIIKHNNTFLSAYAHNSELLVKEGDTVKAGQAIARVGLSNKGVAKLHFEIRRNGKPVNPLQYLPAS